MNDNEFRKLVKDMREAQKAYFKTDRVHEPDQKRFWLAESKRLEKAVDKELSPQRTLEL